MERWFDNISSNTVGSTITDLMLVSSCKIVKGVSEV